MAEKEEKKKEEPWHYKVVSGGEHPDNKPPVTIVSEASDEAIAKEEAAVNAAIEKTRPGYGIVDATPKVDPLKVQLVDPKKDEGKDADNNYEDHTVPELKEIAAKKGVEVNWDDNKTEIIKKLKKAK